MALSPTHRRLLGAASPPGLQPARGKNISSSTETMRKKNTHFLRTFQIPRQTSMGPEMSPRFENSPTTAAATKPTRRPCASYRQRLRTPRMF